MDGVGRTIEETIEFEALDALPPFDDSGNIAWVSATHEEFREARDRRPILAFFQEGVSHDTDQAEFVKEAGAWEKGLFRERFTTPEQLRAQIARRVSHAAFACSLLSGNYGVWRTRAEQAASPDRIQSTAAMANANSSQSSDESSICY